MRIHKVLVAIPTWLQAVIEIVLSTILVIYETEPRFIASLLAVALIKMILSIFFEDGKFIPGRWRRAKVEIKEFLIIIAFIGMLTPIANLTPALGWLLFMGYLGIMWWIFTKGVTAVTPENSHVRRLMVILGDEIQKRHEIIIENEKVNGHA